MAVSLPTSGIGSGRGNRGTLLWNAMSQNVTQELPRTASIHGSKRGIRGEMLKSAIQGTPRPVSSEDENSNRPCVQFPSMALPHTHSVSHRRGMRGDLLWKVIGGGTGNMSARQSEILQEGWLEMSQQRQGSAATWVKAWCITMPGGRVSFFEHGTKTPTVEISSVSVIDCCETELSSPLIVRVRDAKGLADSKTVHLRLESVGHKHKWLAAFRYCRGADAIEQPPRLRRHSTDSIQFASEIASSGLSSTEFLRTQSTKSEEAESHNYVAPQSPDLFARTLSLRDLSLSWDS